MSSLSFDALRSANYSRCEEIFHPVEDWSLSEWTNALAGEVGEACNVAKKIRRMRDGTNQPKDPQTMEKAISMLADELADVIIYADLAAARMGIDLGDAIKKKFNRVSIERKSTHFLG